MRFSRRFNSAPRRWAMIRAPDLRRSLLFVAGADGAAHTQALQSRPDVLVQDLEDFTPQQSKQAAREMSADLFARARASGIIPAVRVNVLSGLGMIDLAAVVPARPELILLPKAESAQQIAALAQEIKRIEAVQGLSVGQIEIVPTAETALGVINLKEMPAVGSNDLSSVISKPCFSARAPCQARLRLSSTRALISTTRCSPEPSRECSSMFLTIASARLPCCTTLSRLPRSVSVNSVISARAFWSIVKPFTASCNSSINSLESPAKLLTKLSGFLISCGMPAVSWPSEASF